MANVHYLGIDLAKNVFQLCGLSRSGRVVYKTRLKRDELLRSVAQLETCTIGVEACTGAFYWQRELESLGHTVRVISPQFVKPFISGQKNDYNDARGIAVALMQPTMKFVPSKTPEQQDIQALHRARQRIVNHRTATACQIRGLLLDRGIPIPKAITRLRRAIPLLLEDATNGLSLRMRRTIQELYELLTSLDERVLFFDKEIEAVFKENDACQRVAKIKGVGPKTATAIVAAIGDGKDFKNGRHFAAWLGLVPRQHSSGDRQVLMNITKRGDQHLRTLLVHGARSVLRTAKPDASLFNKWVDQLRERRGSNKATVAIANKNARIIWSILRNKTSYVCS